MFPMTNARGEQAMPAADMPVDTEYTCPMHPEVHQPGPGNCPICGMALEPLLSASGEEANPELRDFHRRFWWGLPLTVLVTVIAISGGVFDPLFGACAQVGGTGAATPVVLWSGWPFFVRGAQSVGPQPQHVDPDRHGDRRRLRVQRGGNAAPGLFPASFRVDGESRSTSRRRPSSSR